MANRDKIERLDDLIKDTIGGELVEQKATSLLPPGENYGSVMYKVDFKVKKDGKVEEYHAVAKCTPLNKITQELFNTQETFKSEIAWYTTVIPTLKQFANDQGVGRELDFFQQFYGARISLNPSSERVDLDGVILTENLKYRGFINIDRHIGFDLPSTYSILRSLAMFHALPMALRQKNIASFKSNIKPYLPTWASCGELTENDMKKDILKVFDYLPETKDLMGRIRQMVNDSLMFRQRAVREPWITALHLDFWINNIMINKGSNDKIVILDFQCPGYGSPAADLVFFLLTSVRLDIIDETFDDLVKFYYGELIKDLRELGMPINEFSFEDFCNEIDIEAKGGELAHALSHIQITLGEKGVSVLDASDENLRYETFQPPPTEVNERHLRSYRWVTNQAEKRGWI